MHQKKKKNCKTEKSKCFLKDFVKISLFFYSYIYEYLYVYNLLQNLNDDQKLIEFICIQTEDTGFFKMKLQKLTLFRYLHQCFPRNGNFYCDFELINR